MKREGVPDFFIVGAARSGSTSLYRYLAQHPQLHLPTWHKEPCYFCDFFGISDLQEYLSLFAEAKPGQLRGEASTAYLTCPASAGLIAEANPEARIIMLLRNPAERAYSLYTYMVANGFEPLAPFERALAAEPARAARDPYREPIPGYHYNYLYFESGLYGAQVQRYLERFPADRVLILLFEDLERDPRGTTARVFRFLGVDDSFQPEIAVHNPGARPRSARVQYLLRSRVGEVLRRLRVPRANRIVRILRELNTTDRRPPPPDPETYNRLVERYAEDIRATAARIGRNLDAWLVRR